MEKAMDIFKVFKILLEGGYIASTEYVQKKTEYYVFSEKTNFIGERKGHITQKQLENLCSEGIIIPQEQRKDKYGNIITFYYLPEKHKRGY